MAVVFTLPPRTIQGAGTLESNQITPGFSEVKFLLTQIAWPNVGGVGFTYSIEVSIDEGVSWRSVASGDVHDVVVPVTGIIIFSCTLPNSGSPLRRVRLTYNFVKSLRISGTVEVI